jgi:hypothetical protein
MKPAAMHPPREARPSTPAATSPVQTGTTGRPRTGLAMMAQGHRTVARRVQRLGRSALKTRRCATAAVYSLTMPPRKAPGARSPASREPGWQDTGYSHAHASEVAGDYRAHSGDRRVSRWGHQRLSPTRARRFRLAGGRGPLADQLPGDGGYASGTGRRCGWGYNNVPRQGQYLIARRRKCPRAVQVDQWNGLDRHVFVYIFVVWLVDAVSSTVALPAGSERGYCVAEWCAGTRAAPAGRGWRRPILDQR